MRDSSWVVSGERALRQVGLHNLRNKQLGTPKDVSSWGSLMPESSHELWVGE